VEIPSEPRRGRDQKPPEARYVLDSRHALSQFYKSIHISYPSSSDRAVPRQKGIAPGGEVFLHGLPNSYGWIGASHRLQNWTDGCVALSNQEIDEIWTGTMESRSRSGP